jgi:hypothetical protein
MVMSYNGRKVCIVKALCNSNDYGRENGGEEQ